MRQCETGDPHRSSGKTGTSWPCTRTGCPRRGCPRPRPARLDRLPVGRGDGQRPAHDRDQPLHPRHLRGQVHRLRGGPLRDRDDQPPAASCPTAPPPSVRPGELRTCSPGRGQWQLTPPVQSGVPRVEDVRRNDAAVRDQHARVPDRMSCLLARHALVRCLHQTGHGSHHVLFVALHGRPPNHPTTPHTPFRSRGRRHAGRTRSGVPALTPDGVSPRVPPAGCSYGCQAASSRSFGVVMSW